MVRGKAQKKAQEIVCYYKYSKLSIKYVTSLPKKLEIFGKSKKMDKN